MATTHQIITEYAACMEQVTHLNSFCLSPTSKPLLQEAAYSSGMADWPWTTCFALLWLLGLLDAVCSIFCST